MKRNRQNVMILMIAAVMCMCFATAAIAETASEAAKSFVASYTELVKTQPVRVKVDADTNVGGFGVNTRLVYVYDPGAKHDVIVMVQVSEREYYRWDYDLSSISALNTLRLGQAIDPEAPVNVFLVYEGEELKTRLVWRQEFGRELWEDLFLSEVLETIHNLSAR